MLPKPHASLTLATYAYEARFGPVNDYNIVLFYEVDSRKKFVRSFDFKESDLKIYRGPVNENRELAPITFSEFTIGARGLAEEALWRDRWTFVDSAVIGTLETSEDRIECENLDVPTLAKILKSFDDIVGVGTPVLLFLCNEDALDLQSKISGVNHSVWQYKIEDARYYPGYVATVLDDLIVCRTNSIHHKPIACVDRAIQWSMSGDEGTTSQELTWETLESFDLHDPKTVLVVDVLRTKLRA